LSWKKAGILNINIGKMIDEKKSGNNCRLINQMKGAAGSIMGHLAEGFKRTGNKEFLQLLYIAKGSCGELRSQ
jgi:four helix bundle protein